MTTLEERIGYTFKNPRRLNQALTHKSFHNEQGSTDGHNERLEFLGDAVLDLSLSHHLFERFPEVEEGHLSKMRAGLVNETVLAEHALALGIDKVMNLGRGEVISGGATKPRLLASTFEALIGALYLDAGYEFTDQFLIREFNERIHELNANDHDSLDFKTRLQEHVQRSLRTTPIYRVEREEGPDHEKTFFVEVLAEDRILGRGCGNSKKQAEQDAARNAMGDLS